MADQDAPNVTLEAGTYEILRQRVVEAGEDLRSRLEQLNASRHEVFGSIETALVATDRVTTENNCLPRDMVQIGPNRFLFGYNVHLGLRTETRLEDIFAAFEWNDRQFKPLPLDFLDDPDFLSDFRSLFKYYRETIFAKFGWVGQNLFFVFRAGKSITDIKTFKWALVDGKFQYLGNRSDHEFVFPPQHEFTWTRTHRDLHRAGIHPHISIEDAVFVETVGGNLTIKVEDNTDTGEGIHSEPVDNPDQTLDDAEAFYARVGYLYLLKIRPYQEKAWRYFIYNSKLQEVHRIDAIEQSCVLLPDDHGVIFSSGIYLQNGTLRRFEANATDMLFERRIEAPNREDFLYVFYNRDRGEYILMPYNLIAQSVETPVICHGYSTFDNGEMALFKAEPEPQRHHTIQIWQTPFTAPDFQSHTQSDSYLFKLGNGEIVRCMAECHEILALTDRDESYSGLYVELEKRAGDVADSYFWLDREEAFDLKSPLIALRDAAARAIDEFDKVRDLRRHAEQELTKVRNKTQELVKGIVLGELRDIDAYVRGLDDLRKLRGEIITLKEVRYIDAEALDELEASVSGKSDSLSAACVEFLLGDTALEPYRTRVTELDQQTNDVTRVVEGRELEQAIEKTGQELEMLIEIVGNLRIEDATQTTRIIEQISSIYSSLNRILATLRNRIQNLRGQETAAQFAAQMQLISQAVANALDRCDTPARCDEHLGRLMVQLEELEGKFAEFDDYLVELAEKRTEISSAFEARKLTLVEARNRRTSSLAAVADRLLASISHRVATLDTVEEIHSLYASDSMIDRLRDVVQELLDLDDPVKADDVQSRLKSAREESVRQLRDKQELFVGGENVVAFGKHHFNINTQPFELTVLQREESLALHLTGTRFFEPVDDPGIAELRHVWDLESPAESPQVYRAEFLAFQFLQARKQPAELNAFLQLPANEKLAAIQHFMASRYSEGYVKGVHDADAVRIAEAVGMIHRTVGSLRFPPQARSLAISAWRDNGDEILHQQLTSYGTMQGIFGENEKQDAYLERLAEICRQFAADTGLFPESLSAPAAEYLFTVLTADGNFRFSHEAYDLFDAFEHSLQKRHFRDKFNELRSPLRDDFVRHFELLRDWLDGFLSRNPDAPARYRDEAVLLLMREMHNRHEVVELALEATLEPMLGQHPLIQNGKYALDYLDFIERLEHHTQQTLPAFTAFHECKQRIIREAQARLRIEEFKPHVLSSFVRNQLVDRVFLPLIGANLAKQMGTADENTRTDRMGLLLLISPPGYGKTTLMEYVASRLGVVFMKISGPAISHHVTSLDPTEAPNAAAREELQKLNLAFELGDNLMIYLDDIQHCHPEFLQKFISLCDGQRRIEGVYNGNARTYDFRGRKVGVIMAGNPYTESGEKFRIPDMLANRADTYNLGDMVNSTQFEAFKLSYLENAITSNPVLNPLASRSRKDIVTIIRMAERGTREGLELEGSYSAQEIEDAVSVMKKLIRIRDVILRVNAEYIRSAGQADAYRTEPPFLLQGSYRNMNRLTEKVLPVMNDEELEALLDDHYRNEAQTLTTGAEANLLKLHELLGKLTPEEQERWTDIKKTFSRNLLVGGGDDDNPVTQVVRQLVAFNHGLDNIGDTLREAVSNHPSPTATPGPPHATQRVPVNPETLRQIWELIENQQPPDAPGTETLIDVPSR